MSQGYAETETQVRSGAPVVSSARPLLRRRPDGAVEVDRDRGHDLAPDVLSNGTVSAVNVIAILIWLAIFAGGGAPRRRGTRLALTDASRTPAAVLRTPGAGKRRSIQVIERMVLTPQHSLHLVRVADRTMLIAASPSGCSILEGFPDSVPERIEIR